MVNLWLIYGLWLRMVNKWNNNISGWWFGTWLLFSPIVGMMIQSDFHIVQRGWNHQPVINYWIGLRDNLNRKALQFNCRFSHQTIHWIKALVDLSTWVTWAGWIHYSRPFLNGSTVDGLNLQLLGVENVAPVLFRGRTHLCTSQGWYVWWVNHTYHFWWIWG